MEKLNDFVDKDELKGLLLESVLEQYMELKAKKHEGHYGDFEDDEYELHEIKSYAQAKNLYAQRIFKALPQEVNILRLDGDFLIREGRKDDKEPFIWDEKNIADYIAKLEDI